MKYIRAGAVLSVFLVITFLFFWVTTITNISCFIKKNEQIEECPDTLSAELKQLVEKKSLIERIISPGDYVSHVYKVIDVQKKIPQSFTVTVSKEEALYQITGDAPYWVTQSGYIFSDGFTTQRQNIPKITFYDSIELEKQVPQYIHIPITEIITMLQKQNIQVHNITWETDTDIVVSTTLKEKILINPQKMKKLEIIIPALLSHDMYLSHSDSVTEIDLRFSHLILR